MRTMGKYDEAQRFYTQALEKSVDHDILTSAKCTYGLSGVHFLKGNYDEGISSILKAISLYEQLPNNDFDIAQCHRNLGCLYVRKKNHKLARKYMEIALHAYRTIHGEDHPETALMNLNLGALTTETKEYDQAEVYCKQALKSFEKIFHADHRYIALAYCNIGVIYCCLKQYDLSLYYYQKQLEIQQRTIPADSFEFGIAYLNMGEVYEERGEYDQALSYYGKASENFRNAALLPENGAMIELNQHIKSTNEKKNLLFATSIFRKRFLRSVAKTIILTLCMLIIIYWSFLNYNK
ncbi:unnamed protein product [Rotaria sp. Silwood2]|nr:unnamed protein product [Rotaria sp. Silwood2]CAF4121977.1 unnamed protein product [Rotaria sp. Silwood2]